MHLVDQNNESSNLWRYYLGSALQYNKNSGDEHYVENGFWTARLIYDHFWVNGGLYYFKDNFVRVYVKDKATNDELTGVNVIIPGTKAGTITDKNGSFLLPKLDKKYTIKLAFLGYQMLSIKDIDVRKFAADRITINLPSVVRYEEATVYFENSRSEY